MAKWWIVMLGVVVLCAGAVRAETAMAEARFDKHGDLVLDGAQWVEYKDFQFMAVAPRSLILKDAQNRFEPISETRQQAKGDEIEVDKDLMKRMAQRAKDTLKAGEESRKQAAKAAKEQAEADKKTQEKREKIEREAAEKEQERLDRERWAREGYPVRTESGYPVQFGFGFGLFIDNGCHHHRCR